MNRRIGLLCSEPIRERMGGIGIRYAEFAKALVQFGLDTALINPGDPEELPSEIRESCEVRPFQRGRLKEILKDCCCVIAQGQLANHLSREVPDLPSVIDLYDPWLIENLHYAQTLGFDPFLNDHDCWVSQLSHGDFFLCSSEEQRLYYLGFLTALGRVNPNRTALDPDLSRLIVAVPSGLPDEIPPHKPFLEKSRAGQKIILFGGIYDWYDPWTLLEAAERLSISSWEVIFVKNPNPETTPQNLFRQVEQAAGRINSEKRQVRFIDWVPAARRFDLLQDVDVLAAPHRLNIEAQLSLRARYIDAMAVGCPIVAAQGGTVSQLVEKFNAGWTVPPQDPVALTAALNEVFRGDGQLADKIANGRHLAARFTWKSVLKPLAEFCKNPEIDPTKYDFSKTLRVSPPADPRVHTPGKKMTQRIKEKLKGVRESR